MAISSFFNDFYLANDEAVKKFFEEAKKAEVNPPKLDNPDYVYDPEREAELLDLILSRYDD